MFYTAAAFATGAAAVREVLAWVSGAEEWVVLATGIANAGYFTRRALGAGGARQAAALLLAVLYAGTAVLALELLVGGLEGGASGVASRAPLAVANAVTFALIVMGARR